MKKLILHIPHSSTNIPFLDGYVDDENKIQNEIVKLTDWYTEELFFSETDTMIVAPFSRLFCDVERFINDDEEIMSKVGMGATYELFDDGTLLRKLTPKLRKKILKDYYHKHHIAFNVEVDRQLKQYGKVLILDCHSFSPIPFNRDLDKNTNRPDFNIGTDTFHTPNKLIDKTIQFFDNLSYSCGLNWPYNGSIVPINHYQKNKNVKTIMLEINRNLYLNEPSNNKSENFIKIKEIVSDYIQILKSEFHG
jgi:N-formylglutamate deformylase